MSIEYVDGKPFADDALPVDHPKCCGECYLWCELGRIDADRRDDAVPVNQRDHLCAHEKFVDPERMKMRAYPLKYDDMSPGAQRSVVYTALSLRSGVRDCYYCNERVEFEFTGDEVRAMTECPAKEGVIMKNTVSFPSGKIVVDDDMRDVHDIDPVREGQFASYNAAYGQGQVVAEYAKHNIAYGPVGNSCPGIYRDGEGYLIGSPEYDSEYDKQLSDWGEALAGVCTDLWAYTIMDYDQYIAGGGTTDMSWTRTVIEVEPGTYEFEHYSGNRNFDGDANPVVYARFRRISD